MERCGVSIAKRIDSLGLGPESFEIVEFSLFMVENVHHDIVEIEQYPETFTDTLGS